MTTNVKKNLLGVVEALGKTKANIDAYDEYLNNIPPPMSAEFRKHRLPPLSKWGVKTLDEYLHARGITDIETRLQLKEMLRQLGRLQD
jgi:hypothetical protein